MYSGYRKFVFIATLLAAAGIAFSKKNDLESKCEICKEMVENFKTVRASYCSLDLLDSQDDIEKPINDKIIGIQTKDIFQISTSIQKVSVFRTHGENSLSIHEKVIILATFPVTKTCHF